MDDQKVEFEAIECVPFNNELTRDEMVAHFRHYHGYDPLNWSGRSKATKDQLIKWHEADHDDWERTVKKVRNKATTHVHVAIIPEDPTAEFMKHAEFAESLDKPLTATQKNSLKALVDNDFASLRKEIEEFSAEVLTRREAEITSEYAKRQEDMKGLIAKIEFYQNEFRETRNAARDVFAANLTSLSKTAEKMGLSIHMDNVYSRDPDTSRYAVTVTGEAEAIKAARDETTREKQSALIALERKRLGAQRAIMLAGIPKESLDLLQKVPTAKTLMQEAAVERERTKMAARNMLEAAKVDSKN